MAQERTWNAVTALFAVNGTSTGVITVADVAGFFVGQAIQITSSTQPTLHLKVRRVNGSTEIIVATSVANGLAADVSAFLIADNAAIAAFEQLKPKISPLDQEQSTFAAEPILARRVIPVDQYGRPMGGEDNPIVADVDVTVNSVGLFTLPYDSIAAAYPSSTVETYQSYLGGLSGTPVQLITVTYVDATKNVMQSVVRTPTGP